MTPSRPAVLDPAPPTAGGGGGSGRWSWLLTAQGIVEAELVRGALEGEGIPVFLDARDSSPFAWMYPGGNVNAPVKVYVPAGLLDAAKLHLLEAGLGEERIQPTEAQASAGPGPGILGRVLRLILVATVSLVVAWIVLITIFGSATCSLRLFC